MLERRAEPAAARLPVERRPLLSSLIATATAASSGREHEQRRCRRRRRRPSRLSSARAPAEAHRRQRHDRHALDVVERRVRREDLEVARHDRDLHVGPAHRAHEVERLLVARRPTRRAGRGRSRSSSTIVGDVGRASRAPARAAVVVAVAVEEADDLEAVLGVRLDLAVDEHAPRRRCRRSACAAAASRAGRPSCGSSRATTGTSTSATARKSERLDRACRPTSRRSSRRPARGAGSRASPTSIAWKRSRTSSKLETEIRRLSLS